MYMAGSKALFPDKNKTSAMANNSVQIGINQYFLFLNI